MTPFEATTSLATTVLADASQATTSVSIGAADLSPDGLFGTAPQQGGSVSAPAAPSAQSAAPGDGAARSLAVPAGGNAVNTSSGYAGGGATLDVSASSSLALAGMTNVLAGQRGQMSTVGDTGHSDTNSTPVAITGVAPAHGQFNGTPLTNSPNPIVSGTAPALSRVVVWSDAGSSVTTQSGTSGAWSVAAPGGMSDGPHSFFADAYDGSNFLGQSNPYSFILDTTPPVVDFQAPTYTANTTPTVVVTANSTDPYGLNGQVFVDVDLTHTGQFNAPGALGYGTGTLSGNQAQITLNAL